MPIELARKPENVDGTTTLAWIGAPARSPETKLLAHDETIGSTHCEDDWQNSELSHARQPCPGPARLESRAVET
ncbi:hypothetical protein [Natrinema gelatinilyticum]|uniref:hypothetical protein n=1 Tax=Natrinema gelatinilyticum TaxID=2961571 RepID=UPI0020C21BAA|nr:hypothetical protein [Natrinema gelatinilyticum]